MGQKETLQKLSQSKGKITLLQSLVIDSLLLVQNYTKCVRIKEKQDFVLIYIDFSGSIYCGPDEFRQGNSSFMISAIALDHNDTSVGANRKKADTVTQGVT